MRHRINSKNIKRLLCIALMASMLGNSGSGALASTSQELKKQQKELEKQQKELEKKQNEIESQKAQSQSGLDNANSNISEIQSEQAEITEGLNAAKEELVGLLTSIDLIQADIANTQIKIEETQKEYDEAKAQEDALYSAMKLRIKYMYEKGELSYAELLLQAQSFNDLLNKAGYAESLYEYDRNKLTEYVQTKNAAEAYGEELAEAMSELETSEYELKEQQSYTESVIAKYKKEYANFDVQLAKAKQDAAVYTAQLQQQTSQIRELQSKIDAKQKEVKDTAKAAEAAASKEAAEAKKKQEAEAAKLAAANASTSSSDTQSDSANSASSSSSAPAENSSSAASSSSSSAPAAPAGSATGQNIANYACQFVGNPYVAGGTSLTNGADCSGFVYSVYKAFGISVPRSSYSQATFGREVSYDNAQAGDVIYYGGHVAIYLGGGRIVHASTARTGIKYENATYRTILTIRRFI